MDRGRSLLHRSARGARRRAGRGAPDQRGGRRPGNVSPAQGQLLLLLARAQGARRILEIGTLGGYSTIWLARALPAGGRMVTLEADPKHAEVARSNIARAGLADVVELRIGRALELSRRGTLIVADNVVRGGAVIDADSADPDIQGVRRFNELLAAEPRVTATAIQTVGSKGHDGFVIALVT